MTLAPSDAEALAARLIDGQAEHVQLRSLVHDHPEMDLADAYAVQHAWAGMRIAAGARLIGYKVGLTLPAVQRACGIVEPTYGHLFDDMDFTGAPAVASDRLFEPRFETELAFVLKHDLSGPACTVADVLAATDYVSPAIEVVDMRFRLKDPLTGSARGTFDAVADNTSSAGMILGDRRFGAHDIDLRWAGAILYRNGIIEASGISGSVLDNPAGSLAWLANALHARGEGLKAGQVVLSGSFITPLPGGAGDRFKADYGPLGSIAFRLD